MTKLHQIWISDGDAAPPQWISKKIQDLQRMYPDCEHHLYNRPELLKFIETHFNSNVVQAFKKVKPYAFKADLGRYCLLYVHGGYYFDAAICPRFRYEHNDDAFILQGETVVSNGEVCHNLDNGIMYFKEPFSPFLKSAIDKTVDNILNNKYGRNPLDVTGPSLLYDLDHSTIKKFIHSVVDGKKVTCIDERVWFEYQHGFSAALDDSSSDWWPNNVKITKETAKGTNSYSKMWQCKDIFDDEVDCRERRTRELIVNRLYDIILGREADDEGLKYYSIFPLDVDAVSRSLLSSVEYTHKTKSLHEKQQIEEAIIELKQYAVKELSKGSKFL